MDVCLPCHPLKLPCADSPHQGTPGPSLSSTGSPPPTPHPSACLQVSAKSKWWWLTLAIASSEEIAFLFLLGWSWLISTTGGWVPKAESTPSLKGWGWTSKSHCENQELFFHRLLVGKSFIYSQPGMGETRNTSTSSIDWAHCKRSWRIHNFHPDPQVTLAPLFLLVKPQLPGQQQLVQKSNFSLHAQGVFVSS